MFYRVFVSACLSVGVLFAGSAVSAPRQLTATATLPPQVTLTWIASSSGSGAISYDIYRNGALVASTATTSYKDVSVYPATSYSYSVVAYGNSGDRSGSSNTVTAKIPAPSEGTAPPPQATGYTLVYGNDFRSFDVSQNWTGQFHDWYNSEYGVVKPVSSARTSVSESVLSLDWLPGDGANDSAVTSFDIGGHTGRAFRYGYFEAQMSWNPAPGAWPAFWLLSLNSATGNGQWGEIDAFEGQGQDPGMFFGTIHSWTAVNGVRSQTSNPINYFFLGGSNVYSQWHKYGVLWEPGSITWYYDNNPVLTAPAPSILETQDMELILCMEEGLNWMPGDSTGVTVPKLKLQVDSVRVWQHFPSVTTISTNGVAFRGN